MESMTLFEINTQRAYFFPFPFPLFFPSFSLPTATRRSPLPVVSALPLLSLSPLRYTLKTPRDHPFISL